MINKKLPVISLVFYILAALLFIFAVWSANHSFRYISDLVSMGQVVIKDSLFDIISFHLNSFGQYVIYAALLFGIGWTVNLFAGVEVETYEFDDEELEALDELFDEALAEEEEED